jgi:hypothetical protein
LEKAQKSVIDLKAKLEEAKKAAAAAPAEQ